MADNFKKNVGNKGEIAAAEYLVSNDYQVVKVNYKTKYGEVDIICKNGDYIVFVEVKTRKKGTLASGVYSVNKKKTNNIFKVASFYISDNKIDKQPRFDIIEVEHDVSDDSYRVAEHYEDAFWQGVSYGVF